MLHRRSLTAGRRRRLLLLTDKYAARPAAYVVFAHVDVGAVNEAATMFALAVINNNLNAARRALVLMGAGVTSVEADAGGTFMAKGRFQLLSAVRADLFARIPPHVVQKVLAMQEDFLHPNLLYYRGQPSTSKVGVETWKRLVVAFTVRLRLLARSSRASRRPCPTLTDRPLRPRPSFRVTLAAF